MYERFTDRARLVMQLANQEAQRFNHSEVDTGHILIGIVKEGNGIAATVAANLGLNIRAVRLAVEEAMPVGAAVLMGKLPQSGKAKAAVAAAIQEAKELGHNYVGTEHLLLGLLRGEGGVAADVLRAHGATPDGVRDGIRELLKGERAPAAGLVKKWVVSMAAERESPNLYGVWLDDLKQWLADKNFAPQVFAYRAEAAAWAWNLNAGSAGVSYSGTASARAIDPATGGPAAVEGQPP